MKKQILSIVVLFLLQFVKSTYADSNVITVAKDGSGDFKTVTEALKSLPMFTYGRVVIFIKNGVYEEKLRIENDNVTLEGEDREKTIIRFNQLRSHWDKNPDQIGPGVVNIFADDIIFKNMTIENTQPQIGPHAFAVYGFGTRIILLNCNLISKGGDTVSLWNYKNGMYFYVNCYFEGSVDFVCPRGWCFIKDSKFYEHVKTASIWHAGSYNKNQKLVIRNSSFDGVEGFELGRHHYEAQFYLLDCVFSKNMSDREIYRVSYPNEPQRNRAFNWGKRYYFNNCHKDGGDLDWFKNNLNTAEASPKPDEITARWTFDDRWDPESTAAPKIVNYKIDGDSLYLNFSENVTIDGLPVLKSNSGVEFKFYSGGENTFTRFVSKSKFSYKDLSGLKIINDSKIIATIASVNERKADLSIK